MSETTVHYRFGPFEADVRRHMLLREGRTIPLSQRPFELLIALLERPGKTISRSRLLERLWSDRVVGEASLTQAVFVLRKALADHPEAPRFIQTVPRGGYRFIAPVQTLTANPDSDPDPEERSQASARAGAAPGPGGTRTTSVRPPAAGMARQLRRVRSRLHWAVSALALIALGFAGVVVFAPSPSFRLPFFEAVPSLSTQSASLAVLPFVVTEPDRELHLLALSISDLLVTRLGAQSELLLVKPPPDLTSEAPREALAISAQAAHLDYLLAGSLRRAIHTGDNHRGEHRDDAHEASGDNGSDHGEVRLALTLYELDDDGMLRTIPLQGFDIPFIGADGDVERFVATRDGIVAGLLDALSPAIRSRPRRRDLHPATIPHHAEAYRLYLRALHDVRGATCTGQKAMARLQSSLELDPEFAPAWDVLGWAHYNVVVFCGAHASHYAQALESADRALGLVPDLARSIALKATILIETGRGEDAYALLAEARRESPWRADIEFLAAYALRYAGYLDEAARILEGLLARDPVFMGVEGWTPNTLLYQGKHETFLDWLPAADAPIFLYYRALARLTQHKPEEARRMLASGFQANPNDPFAQLSQALAAILAQDKIRARVLLGALVLHRKRQGMGDGEFTYKIAQLHMLAGESDRALDQLRLAVEQGFFNAPYLERDWVFERLRNETRFQEIVRTAKTRHREFGRRFGLVEPSATRVAAVPVSKSR